MPQKVNTDHRLWVALAYHETKNCLEVRRRFTREFPTVNPPSNKTTKQIYEKLFATGSVQDKYKGHAGAPVTAVTEENV